MHRVLDHLAGELADLGLSQAEINALAALRPGTPRPIGEIAAATGQRRSTLTGVLDRLEGRRLVTRQVNPADRRSFVVEPTPSGEAAVARVHNAFAALDARLRADLSASATAGFHDVLAAIERHTKGRA